MNPAPEEYLDSAIDGIVGIGPRVDSTAGTDKAVAELAQFATELRGQVPVARPSAEAVQRGREKLFAELDAQPRPVVMRPDGLVSGLAARVIAWRAVAAASLCGWPAATGAARRVAVVVVLVCAALGLTGTLGASANSLPGDPLYDLKRIQEQVRLSIAVDDRERAGLQQQIDEIRVLELDAIRRQMRVARTDVSGTVDRVDGDTITVDTIAFVVDRAQFPAAAEVAPGERVTLGLQTNADGSVLVVAFRRMARSKPADESSGRAARATSSATARPVASATATAQPSASATAPAPVAPAVHNEPTGTATSTPSATHVPSHSPTPTATEEFRHPTPGSSSSPTPVEFRRNTTLTPVPELTPRARPTRPSEPTRTPEPSQTARARETPRDGGGSGWQRETPEFRATHEAD